MNLLTLNASISQFRTTTKASDDIPSKKCAEVLKTKIVGNRADGRSRATVIQKCVNFTRAMSTNARSAVSSRARNHELRRRENVRAGGRTAAASNISRSRGNMHAFDEECAATARLTPDRARDEIARNSNANYCN